MSTDSTPPFPALTTAQRWHLDVYGYVVVEDVLDPEQLARTLAALHSLKAEFAARPDPWQAIIRNCSIFGQNHLGDHLHFHNLIEARPEFLEYVAHPRIRGMVEEVVGAGVRVVEVQAAINSRDPEDDYDGPGRYTWHRARPESQSFTVNGLYHCTFVKAITNLTDLGQEDGGTVVIAGSHKATCAEEAIIQAVRQDPSLIHQVVAPAGSTLIFCETLLHATGDLRSDKERAIIITGYQPWDRMSNTGRPFSSDFAERVPKQYHRLIFGSDLNARLRRRTLDMEVGSGDPGEYYDGFSLTSTDPESYESNEITRSRLGRQPMGAVVYPMQLASMPCGRELVLVPCH